ncbi:MAG: hypothetical protein PVG27_06955, partial [Chloroflexota bacterium]
MQPGQFVHVVAPRPAGLLLPAVPVASFDRVAGTIGLLLAGERSDVDLAALRAGDQAELEGPL